MRHFFERYIGNTGTFQRTGFPMGGKKKICPNITGQENKMNQEQYARKIRQKIMATAVVKHGWDKDQVHDYMIEWGFGASLRSLKVPKLLELFRLINGREKPNIPEEFQLDEQGNYMYHVMKLAGWNMQRVRALMISKYEKSDWSLLDQKERRAVVQILKNYAESDSSRRKRKGKKNAKNAEVK